MLTKGYASFIFSAWGYANRKRLGTAALEKGVTRVKSYNTSAWLFIHNCYDTLSKGCQKKKGEK